LIKTDLLDVIKGPQNGESSSETRAKIAKAIEEGKPCSVRCGIKVEEKKILLCVTLFSPKNGNSS
jgi:hypothetical protein